MNIGGWDGIIYGIICKGLIILMTLKAIKKFLKEKKSDIKNICRILVTMCTIVTAIASVILAKKALDVSGIALKTSSSATEPILNMDIEWDNDKITVVHETSDIFQIRYVTFGLVRTIAVMSDDAVISSIEVQEKSTGLNLEHGHTTGTDCSDEDAEKLNKKFKLQLDTGYSNANAEKLDLLEEKVRERCDASPYSYWEVSPYYNYRYIIVDYIDVYGNRRSQYYIYKYEYTTSWRIYKLSEEEFEKYTESIMYRYDETELLDKLFSNSNFKSLENTKYCSYAEWDNSKQFK